MKSIAKVWTFKSSSSDKTYQALLYSDGSTSCDCPGWTRRCDSSGKRTCRHTRSVELGNADAEAANFHSYDQFAPGALPKKSKPTPSNLCQPILTYGHRKLCI
jgi:hypothetical protein